MLVQGVLGINFLGINFLGINFLSKFEIVILGKGGKISSGLNTHKNISVCNFTSKLIKKNRNIFPTSDTVRAVTTGRGTFY